MVEAGGQFPEHVRLTAMEWHIRIADGGMSEAERAAFETWRAADGLHERAYDRAARLWSAYGELDAQAMNPALFDREPIRLPAPQRQFWASRIPSVRPMKWVATFAGVVLLSLLVAQAWLSADGDGRAASPTRSYASDIGEVRRLVLADSSEMTLGPGTRVEVAMTDSARAVRLLRGAAVFRVESDPDRPFYVEADRFRARAVGTVFDVRNNGGVIRLSVSEGVVEATHPYAPGQGAPGLLKKESLSAGELLHATSETGLSPISVYDVADFAAWRMDRLRYDDAPLTELIADANRYATPPIVLDASFTEAANMRVTFSFSGKRVDRMLAALPKLFPIVVDTSDPSQTVISEKPSP